MTSLKAEHFIERSPVYPQQDCALTDLSDLSRVGFRGTDSAAWLKARGYRLPAVPNQALRQDDGSLAVRLSQTEYLLLGSLHDMGARIAAEETSWAFDDSRNYLLPRHDSHAWVQLSGRHCADVMAKLCGVDLRPQAFGPGAVAQTSAARINVIVINAGSARLPALQILCDRASAEYFRGALLDAMEEFNGGLVGIDALTSA